MELGLIPRSAWWWWSGPRDDYARDVSRVAMTQAEAQSIKPPPAIRYAAQLLLNAHPRQSRRKQYKHSSGRYDYERFPFFVALLAFCIRKISHYNLFARVEIYCRIGIMACCVTPSMAVFKKYALLLWLKQYWSNTIRVKNVYSQFKFWHFQALT